MNKKPTYHVQFSASKISAADNRGELATTLRALTGDDEQAYEQFVSEDLAKLYDFTQRELEYHDRLNQLGDNMLDPHDIINQAIANLIDKQKQPRVKLGRNLYDEVLNELHQRVSIIEERERRETSINENAKDPAEEGGFRTIGEHVLDFWQPDQDLAAVDFIADTEVPTPEEIHDMKERQNELYSALGALPIMWRENFILFAVERWPVRELAEMREVSEDKMKSEIRVTQSFLRERMRDRQLLLNRDPRQNPHQHKSA